MNERIENLAQGCFEHIEGTLDGDIVEFDYKKFAELIVQECAKESRLAVQRAFDHGLTNTIPEYVEVAVCRHFGVG